MSCYCISCGNPIPDGQGGSCSMCYGDIDHGRDGYYRQHMEETAERQQAADQIPGLLPFVNGKPCDGDIAEVSEEEGWVKIWTDKDRGLYKTIFGKVEIRHV